VRIADEKAAKNQEIQNIVSSLQLLFDNNISKEIDN